MRAPGYVGLLSLLLAGCASTAVPAAEPAIASAALAEVAEDAAACINVEDCEMPEMLVVVPRARTAADSIVAEEAQPQRARRVVSAAVTADSHAGPVTPTSKLMAAHFIDIGQGSATLLEFPCGAVLIDTGGEEGDDFSGKANLTNYLDEFFARRTDLDHTLDLVVLSHPHIDHTRGVEALETLPQITVKNVIDNGESDHGSGKRQQVRLRSLAAQYQDIRESEITSVDGLSSPVIDPIVCDEVDPQIRAVWGHLDARPDVDGDGRSDWPEREWINENNHSVVLRVDFGDSSFLFPGDIQQAASQSIVASYEEDSTILDVDVLNVPHHGSENGVTRDLLSKATPRIAVIQAGSNRREGSFTAFGHGHPRKRIVELLTASGGVSGTSSAVMVPVATAQATFVSFSLDKAVFSNSWDGTVILYANTNGQIQVVTENND